MNKLSRKEYRENKVVDARMRKDENRKLMEAEEEKLEEMTKSKKIKHR